MYRTSGLLSRGIGSNSISEELDAIVNSSGPSQRNSQYQRQWQHPNNTKPSKASMFDMEDLNQLSKDLQNYGEEFDLSESTDAMYKKQQQFRTDQKHTVSNFGHSLNSSDTDLRNLPFSEQSQGFQTGGNNEQHGYHTADEYGYETGGREHEPYDRYSQNSESQLASLKYKSGGRQPNNSLLKTPTSENRGFGDQNMEGSREEFASSDRYGPIGQGHNNGGNGNRSQTRFDSQQFRKASNNEMNNFNSGNNFQYDDPSHTSTRVDTMKNSPARDSRSSFQGSSRGFHQSGRGRNENNQGGYKNIQGEYESDRDGYKNSRGGYQNSRGGYENSRGGFDNSRGGHQNGRGGFESSRGGHQNSRGGFDNSRGGHQNSRGGFESSRGGHQNSRGGHQNSRGGFERGRGAYETGRGGFKSGRGGFETGRGGFEKIRGGSESSRGGYRNSRGGHQDNSRDYQDSRGSLPDYHSNSSGGGKQDNPSGFREGRASYQDSHKGGLDHSSNRDSRPAAPASRAPILSNPSASKFQSRGNISSKNYSGRKIYDPTNKHEKLPDGSFCCHVCKLEDISSEHSYIAHLDSPGHMKRLDQLLLKNEKYEEFKRAGAKLASFQFEPKSNREALTDCTYCLCEVPSGSMQEHNELLQHRELMEFTRPLCCGTKFSDRKTFENHRNSKQHLLTKHNLESRFLRDIVVDLNKECTDKNRIECFVGKSYVSLDKRFMYSESEYVDRLKKKLEDDPIVSQDKQFYCLSCEVSIPVSRKDFHKITSDHSESSYMFLLHRKVKIVKSFRKHLTTLTKRTPVSKEKVALDKTEGDKSKKDVKTKVELSEALELNEDENFVEDGSDFEYEFQTKSIDSEKSNCVKEEQKIENEKEIIDVDFKYDKNMNVDEHILKYFPVSDESKALISTTDTSVEMNVENNEDDSFEYDFASKESNSVQEVPKQEAEEEEEEDDDFEYDMSAVVTTETVKQKEKAEDSPNKSPSYDDFDFDYEFNNVIDSWTVEDELVENSDNANVSQETETQTKENKSTKSSTSNDKKSSADSKKKPSDSNDIETFVATLETSSPPEDLPVMEDPDPLLLETTNEAVVKQSGGVDSPCEKALPSTTQEDKDSQSSFSATLRTAASRKSFDDEEQSTGEQSGVSSSVKRPLEEESSTSSSTDGSAAKKSKSSDDSKEESSVNANTRSSRRRSIVPIRFKD